MNPVYSKSSENSHPHQDSTYIDSRNKCNDCNA